MSAAPEFFTPIDFPGLGPISGSAAPTRLAREADELVGIVLSACDASEDLWEIGDLVDSDFGSLWSSMDPDLDEEQLELPY